MYGKMQKSGLREIIPFICSSLSCIFLHPEFLSVYYREWLQPEICQITQVFFSFLSAPRAQRFKDLEG